MNNKDGSLVKFDFARKSKATYFNSDMDMKEVPNDIPRIDFGNYSADRKILIEKESTNLIEESTFENGLDKYTSKDRCEVVDDYNTFNFINRICEITRDVDSSGYLYQRNTINEDQVFALSSFIYNPNKYPTNTRTSEGIGYLHDGDSKIEGRFYENVYYENGFNRTSVSGTPEISGVRNRGWVHYARQTLEENIKIFGMQLELQDKQTSYIPTYGEPVTRSKDSLSLNIANNSSVLVCGTEIKQVIDKQGLFKVEDYIQNDGLTLLAIFDELTDKQKLSLLNSKNIKYNENGEIIEYDISNSILSSNLVGMELDKLKFVDIAEYANIIFRSNDDTSDISDVIQEFRNRNINIIIKKWYNY